MLNGVCALKCIHTRTTQQTVAQLLVCCCYGAQVPTPRLAQAPFSPPNKLLLDTHRQEYCDQVKKLYKEFLIWLICIDP